MTTYATQCFRVQDQGGRAIPNATVLVTDFFTGATATIYSPSDPADPPATIPNPMLSDGNGFVLFATPAGTRYTIEVTGVGLATQVFPGLVAGASLAVAGVSSIAYVAPAAGITISGTTPVTGTGTWTFALADDLAALEGLSGTGWAKRTAANTWAVSATIPWTDISGAPATYAPSAHASSHASAGSDPVTIDQSQVTGLVAALAGKQASDTQLTSLAGLSYAGNALKVIRVNAGETDFELATPSAGGTPGGADKQVQINDAGAFFGEAGFEYDKTTNQLTVPGATITEDFALTGDISPTQIAADQNNYNPTGLSTASVLRLTSDASRSITGLSDGAEGRILILLNRGSNDIVLKHESASSTAANRFKFSTSSDLTLTPGAGIELIYDATDSRWLPVFQTGSLPWSEFDVDAPSPSPSPYDDEFNTASATVDAKWTAQPNWSGLTSTDVDTTSPLALYINNPATGGTSTYLWRCILQSLPAGDFTVIAKVGVPSNLTSYTMAGIVFSSSGTAGAGTQFFFGWRSNGTLGCEKYTNFNTYSSTLLSAPSYTGSFVYLRIRLSGSTWYVAYSSDGRNWTESTITPGFTPTHFGLGASNSVASAAMRMNFEYFRYWSSANVALGARRTYNATVVSPAPAPQDATFLVLSTNGVLSNERVATAGQGISFTDAGAGSTFTIAFDGQFGTTRGNMTATSASTTAGDFWNDSTQKAMSHYFNAVQQQLSGVIYTLTSDGNCTNTVAETSILGTGIGTKTLPADFLVAGKTIRLTLRCYYTTTASPTLNIKFLVGGATVASTGAVTHSSTAGSILISIDYTCRTTGAGGTAFCQGYSVRYVAAGNSFAEMKNTATTAIDTTVSRTLDVTATWSAASASNSIVCTNATIEILN